MMPGLHGRSSLSNGSSTQHTAQWAQKVPKSHTTGSEGKESSPPFTGAKTTASTISLGGAKTYPLPYHPTPPPTPPNSSAKQLPPDRSHLSGGRPAHQGLSNGKADSGASIHQSLQSTSDPQLAQSQFLSRLELMERELSEVKERLDTEREQFVQKLLEISELSLTADVP